MKKILTLCVFFTFWNCKQAGQETAKTAEELRMELKIHEELSPVEYLKADGKYDKNFWGTKFKVNCVVKNDATLVTYKDAVLRVTYYSKTKTELANKDITLYEIFPPNSSKSIELKVDNYADVNSIGWEIINAIPVE